MVVSYANRIVINKQVNPESDKIIKYLMKWTKVNECHIMGR